MITINGHTFESCEELGGVIGVIPQGKKFLVVREYGIEKFHPAIEPSRCRLELLHKSPRRIINLKQAKYRIKRRQIKNESTISFP